MYIRGKSVVCHNMFGVCACARVCVCVCVCVCACYKKKLGRVCFKQNLH